MTPERLVQMTNQIADYFGPYGHDEAVAGITDHLRRFWDPRMRKALVDLVAGGGGGLRPLVIEAAKRLPDWPGTKA